MNLGVKRVSISEPVDVFFTKMTNNKEENVKFLDLYVSFVSATFAPLTVKPS